MRHRGQRNQRDEDKTTVTGVTGTVDTLNQLLDSQPADAASGRHRRPLEASLVIPGQKSRDHDADTTAQAAPLELERVSWEPEDTTTLPVAEPELEVEVEVEQSPAVVIPATARWTASNMPRVFAGALLAMAALGTATLGVRYVQSRSADDFVALVISVAVVVALWGIMIASTPQVLTLNGSVLSIHNSRGVERFDLADGLQPVDLVGAPTSSKWALLLHRPDATTVVLRRHDVVAAQIDPIVRHYRVIAAERYAERQARFTR